MDFINNNIIFETINNGIIILDEDLNILAWNKWLEVRTNKKSSEMIGKNICKEFEYINENKLKRKIKSVLITNNASYYSVDPHKFLIDIKVNTIVNKVFESMQQDITIVPYDIEKKLVCLYIYDNTKLCEINYKLEELNDKLKELSNCDPLTNVYNRRYFSEISNKMLSLTTRNGHDLGIIILDIDKFKNINDTYGHGIGDKVIILLAQNLKEIVRDSDIVSRFGGEEFVVLMYNITLENAQNVAEKIRQYVENIEVIDNDLTLKFTVSLGVALYDENLDERNLEHTLKRADEALYLAKQSGRNQVRVSL